MLWINSKKPVANYHRICLCLAHFTSSSSTCFHCIFSIYAVRQFQRASSSSLLLLLPSLSAWTAFWTNSVLSFARTSALAVAILSCHSAAATQHFYAGQSVSENPSLSLQGEAPSRSAQSRIPFPNFRASSALLWIIFLRAFAALFPCDSLHFMCHAKGTCMDHAL